MRSQFDPTSIEYKIWDYRQFGYKFLINSYYGVLGFEDSRTYRKEIAENITLYARAIIKELERLFKDKVLYADTDSLFLKLPDNYDIDQCLDLCQYLEDYINRYIRKWIHVEFGVPMDQIQIEIKTDRIAKIAYLPPVKKKYCLHVIFEDGKKVDYVHIKGFDCVRGNVPLLCREIQEEVLKRIVQLRPISEIRELLEDYRKRLFAGELDDKLVMYVTIRKDLDEYKRTTRHVEAAKMLQKLGYQVVVGDKICYIDTGERVIPYIPGETKLSKKDYEAFWNNRVISVLENLHLNIDWSTFTKQKTLADF
jgi:DNA polymerase I